MLGVEGVPLGQAVDLEDLLLGDRLVGGEELGRDERNPMLGGDRSQGIVPGGAIERPPYKWLLMVPRRPPRSTSALMGLQPRFDRCPDLPDQGPQLGTQVTVDRHRLVHDQFRTAGEEVPAASGQDLPSADDGHR